MTTPSTQGRNEGMRFDRIFLTECLGEVTWCHEKIEEHDVEYVNKSLMDTRDAEHKKEMDRIREAFTNFISQVSTVKQNNTKDWMVYINECVSEAIEANSLTEPASTKGNEG